MVLAPAKSWTASRSKSTGLRSAPDQPLSGRRRATLPQQFGPVVQTDGMTRHHPPFDPASEDWVMVSGQGFFFEPIGAEFAPPMAGSVVVTFGNRADGHCGVEVTYNDGFASIWMPAGARAYWLADSADTRKQAPWETRLAELDHERGRLA